MAPSRRALLAGAAAASVLPGGLLAAATEGPHDFDALTEAARRRAMGPPPPVPDAGAFARGLDYDGYRHVGFDPDRARWAAPEGRFRLHAFHLGWLFGEPVPLMEVRDGRARLLRWSADDFVYRGPAKGIARPGEALPGVSGFRLNAPLNRPGVFDEVIAFQGASYFRALGRGNAYGASARGLAIDTATGRPEEFPRFSAFYLHHPGPGAEEVVIDAALDGDSVAGAYRFVVRPGAATTVDVTARLFLRRDVEQLGVAPLTSMYLHGEAGQRPFDDYRPRVHDSDGLVIRRRGGDVLWRALANPPRLAASYFGEASPLGFGLHQRRRGFEAYQDAGARYEDRPSIDVEALGEWGEGTVRLVEIPTDLEVHDNIVASWVPGGPIRAGSAHEFRYRLHWGMLEPDGEAPLAHVAATLTGLGGVSGTRAGEGTRKFVVDFAGGPLASLGPDADVEARVLVARGREAGHVLSKLPDRDAWRLVIDAEPEPGAATELVAWVEGFGDRLSETWLYRWNDPR